MRFTQRLPSGPVLIVWDREACAECHMHVGEPRFAGQIQTKDGQVLNFDDPGCLLRYHAQRRPAVHAMYLRHFRKDRWLRAEEASFVLADGSPMGYDLAAVDATEPGALPFSAAQARALARRGSAQEAAP